ncbi:Cullin-domain-containing protein [Myriangium duriaei CBS 260.36]|uniref:Cullin-domain-containing protein n=1 Tax=Myriangium duriaei CBS 260.36 TaxID=1168546 RepID=A0A9P4J1B1_9PEZI|nr:Cullin-domain-containing protein [Myriangium duriaei CBS 260.36]
MLAGRGKTKIRAPRRGLNQAADVDFDKTWEVLESAFLEIHTKNASNLSFETLYRSAYKLVLKKQGEALYQKVADFETRWLSQEVKGKVVGTLSQDLIDGPSVSTTSGTILRRTAEERFLRELRQVWQDHQTAMSMMTDVMMYMDRVYCTDTRRPSIFAKAMSLFRDNILYALLDRSNNQQRRLQHVLTDIVLDQIKMDRDGDFIDKHLVRANIYMLEGLFETDMEAEDEKLYLKQFEEYFIQDSIAFYQQEGELLLKQSDAGSYCRHTMRRIKEEQDRCRSTLSEMTSPKITAVVEDQLIRNKIKVIIEMESGVQFMINNDKLSDLRLVFELEKRVDAKKTELTKTIQKIIAEMGQGVNNAAITASASTAAPQQQAGEDGDEKPKLVQDRQINIQTVAALKWVEDILALKDKFDRIWTESLMEDQILQTVLTRSLGDVINSFARCSEYISLFIDDNMKKGIKGKTEEEVDRVLEKAITLLRYVQDKDIFESYYKRHLCRRLIMNKSLSIDAERSMISRMKIELGNSFTLKLEAMFKDMSLSEELTAGYKNYISSLGDLDHRRTELGIHVLTFGTWPLDTMRGLDDERDEKLKTIYPSTIDTLKTSFEKYYSQKYSGRVLSWQGNMGTADIKATFPKVPTRDGPPKPRTHELNVSTYAMVILMIFNDIPATQSLTFEEIQGRTNIPTNELVRNLQSLAVAPKTRVLIKEPMSKDVKKTDSFSFNESFTSKFIKIKVGVVSASNRVENDRERKETEKKNNDSRGFVVEAAIVRIMKQRKDLTHAQLVTETLSQLSSKFKPEVGMIKKKIESLIEREYLERVEVTKDHPPRYKYVA